MTVAVACNLSDGVVLAVDSAVTVPSGDGSIAKVYENAEKLFQLGDRPIGVAVYGLGSLGPRSIGSYINEFQTRDPQDVLSGDTQLSEVVEELRSFLSDTYAAEVIPALEAELDLPIAEIPAEDLPALGLVVGGFSHGEFLSELWEIVIPVHGAADSAVLKRGRGQFGTDWFAMLEPIQRYLKGFSPALIDEVIHVFVGQRDDPALTDAESAELAEILQRHEYEIPFAAMPINEGVEHARFLAELVVNHHRFTVGAPVVGGRIRVGSVTYRGGRFQILDR